MGCYVDKENRYGTLMHGESILYEYEKNPLFCNSHQVSDELFNLIARSLGDYMKISSGCAEAIEKMDNTSIKEIILREIYLNNCFGLNHNQILINAYKDVDKTIIKMKSLTGSDVKKLAKQQGVVEETENTNKIMNEYVRLRQPEKNIQSIKRLEERDD